MKNAIKAYLERECMNDVALKSKYDENKLDGCIKYITEQARKRLNGKNGAIEDTTVYQWARHYILDGDSEMEETDEEVAEAVKAQHVMPERKEEPKKFKPVPGQLDLFGGLV